MTEEDLETTEGESMHLNDKLMELVGWKPVDQEKENVTETGGLDSCLIKFVEHGLRFKHCWTVRHPDTCIIK